jgi:putative SOS response-associated peptidase YedK
MFILLTMCRRLALTERARRVADAFPWLGPSAASLRPRYNIAPGQNVAVILNDGRHVLSSASWGLVAPWARDRAAGPCLAASRIEHLPSRPLLREALRHRRCLVLADGYFEWRAGAEGRTPHFVQLPDGRPFAIAGLWQRWHDASAPGGGTWRTLCALLTRPIAGERRAPAIVRRDAYAAWLDPHERPPSALTPLLTPELPLVAYPVSRYVDRPLHDDPRCIEPAPAPDAVAS